MHHARLFIGDFEYIQSFLPEYARVGGLDVTHTFVDSFGIDDARALGLASSQKPLEAPLRTFVLSFRSATVEAQNALLKTLEDPAQTTEFFVIVPREDVLIATVRSRLQYDRAAGAVEQTSHIAEAFIRSPFSERLKEIEKRTKDKDDAWIEEIVSGIEVWASKNIMKSEIHDVLLDIMLVRTNLPSRGASKKMLLEQLALTLPA